LLYLWLILVNFAVEMLFLARGPECPEINKLCKCIDNVSNVWVQYLFCRGFYAWFLVCL